MVVAARQSTAQTVEAKTSVFYEMKNLMLRKRLVSEGRKANWIYVELLNEIGQKISLQLTFPMVI